MWAIPRRRWTPRCGATPAAATSSYAARSTSLGTRRRCRAVHAEHFGGSHRTAFLLVFNSDAPPSPSSRRITKEEGAVLCMLRFWGSRWTAFDLIHKRDAPPSPLYSEPWRQAILVLGLQTAAGDPMFALSACDLTESDELMWNVGRFLPSIR